MEAEKEMHQPRVHIKDNLLYQFIRPMYAPISTAIATAGEDAIFTDTYSTVVIWFIPYPCVRNRPALLASTSATSIPTLVYVHT
jgi:hypothetical protein